MGLVNQWRLDRLRVKLMLPNVWLRSVRNLPAVIMSRRVLHRAPDAGGDAVAPRAICADDVELDFLAVRKCIARQLELPNTAAGRGQRMGLAVPLIEVSDEGNRLRRRCPLADRPHIGLRMKVDAHKLVARGIRRKGFRTCLDFCECLCILPHPALDGRLVRFQPRIVEHELRSLCHCGRR